MSIFNPLKELGLGLLDLFFPYCCLNCSERLPENFRLLCAFCHQTMLIADPKEHCERCFRALNETVCTHCAKYISPFHKAQAPFITCESTQVLSQKLVLDSGTFLKDSLAAFIILQIAETSFSLPDLLIPFPCKGSLKLTEALSSQLSIPIESSLKRKLTNEIVLNEKHKSHLTDKEVTLVSLGLETRQESYQAGFALAAAYPKSISALYFQISA